MVIPNINHLSDNWLKSKAYGFVWCSNLKNLMALSVFTNLHTLNIIYFGVTKKIILTVGREILRWMNT